MKKSWVTFILWPLLLANQCFAQLDTLYFEDFVDNRHQWTEFDNETGSLAIRDGMLECKVVQAKNRIRFTYLNVPLPVADTFVYEIRMVFDSVRSGGAIYDINHVTNKRTQKQNLCCYDAMVAHRKGLYCYQYFNADGHHDSFWAKRKGEMNRGAHTFRLEHGGNRIYCYFDGEFVDSYRIGKVRRVHTFGKWGWMIRGTGRFKVDYLMVLGKKQ
jgi:hypothetical protein